MTSGHDTHVAASGAHPLLTRALTRESGRARQLLTSGEWRPASSDAEAAAAVLARLTAPLPTQRATTARTPATDRDRRLQRILRTTLHHLDAGAVSPPTAALLAAVARALLPWHANPNPPAAAAAPRYGAASRPSDGVAVAPTEAGEALLPDLIALFTTLAATCPPGTVPLTPPALRWQVPHAGRFRRHGRPATGVWTAETVGCPGCGGTAGPWTVTCDWRLITLGCPCGVVTHEHGLAFSEVWLLLPDA
ncbi:hypothetical protein [Streptomyces sp. ISL-100]|uniref:hypothetical protein n=1 Tax=Streptomyces sp. ISL-100 TaxID=2819173 RepID=UPI001BE94105|nr:hypothetical protein [Streptomyces sp. ISL-100]MBT2395034.1 hypothetical protein [Streptomyces sp. ISL-100]